MAVKPTDPCRVCGHPAALAYSQLLLGRNVGYYDCEQCGYFQTASPDWLAEAYASAINDVDTGIMWRNQLNVRRVVMTLFATGRLAGRVVDHAGGYGILVRLLRDAGVDAYWKDKYCENLVARGFESNGSHTDLTTAFEVFEHLERPVEELNQLLNQTSYLLISTELIEGDAPPEKSWWYLQPEHGQHIGFFRRRTLEWMATASGSELVTDGVNLHLFSRAGAPRFWHLLQRMKRLSSQVCKRKLKSKMLDDFWMLKAHSVGPARVESSVEQDFSTPRQ